MYDVSIQNGDVVRLIHDHRAASNAQKLTTASIQDAVNSISSFQFEINPANDCYDELHEFTTIVRVYNSKFDRYDFIGRILQINPSMDADGAMAKTVICEDRRGYLHDSIQPYTEERSYTGDSKRTGLEEFIDVLLGNHNAQVEEHKRIYRGRVTVNPFKSSDNVRKGLNWETTYDCIAEKLIDSFGGYVLLREEDGKLYLDYLESAGTVRDTSIEVGYNMASVQRELDSGGIVTRLIPLGYQYEDSDERLTIALANEGSIFVESAEFVEKYGIRYGVVIFDEVTDPANLKRKGLEYFSANGGITVSHEVSALDLSLIGLEADDFVLYDSYPVRNSALGIDDVLQIVSKTTDVIEPYNSSFEMGDIKKRMSDVMVGNAGSLNYVQKAVKQVGERVTKTELQIVHTADELTTRIVTTETELEKKVAENKAAISVLSGEIQSQVTREEFDDLGLQVSENSTRISQTAEQIEIAVEGVQIGGENYLLNSGVEVSNAKYAMVDYPLGDPKPTEGETYTLRLWGELGSDREYFQPYNSSGTLPLASKLNDNGDGTHSATFTWKNSSSAASVTPTFLRIYQRNNTGTSVSTITRIKLEAGNRATDWSQHPEEFRAGTNVVMNKDQFSVTTPEFNVHIPTEDGADAMMTIDKDGLFARHIDCQNVMERYDGPGALYVNPNASTVDGVTYFRSLSDAASKLNYRYLDKAVTINLTGTVGQSETVLFIGIMGGRWLTITGTSSSHAKLIGHLQLYYNSTPIKVQYLDIDTISTTLMGIELAGRAQYAIISNCVITGRGDKVGAYGVNSINGAMVKVQNCELYELRRSFRSGDGGLLVASNCKGNCSPGTNLANMHLSGTQACSSASTWTDHPSGGEIYKASVTIDQGSKPSPEPEATSVSYNATSSDVYAGGGWNNYSNSDIYQGYTDALGEHRGCFWFNNSTIRSALKNKTIKQATLTLYQVSGVGRNQPVQVNLEGITATSGTGNSPVGNPEYGVIGTTLSVGKATTFTIPTRVVTDLLDGTINGLMLRTGETASMKGDDNSYNYARFAGFESSNKPVLTITYTS